MELGFIAALGWVVIGLAAYSALMLVGAAWSYAIRERDVEALIPLVTFHVLFAAFAVGFLALPSAL